MVVLLEQGSDMIELGLGRWGDSPSSALDFLVLLVSVIAIVVLLGALAFDLLTYRSRERDKRSDEAEFRERLKARELSD